MSSESLRTLLLPMRVGTEDACNIELETQLTRLHVLPEDFLNWVSLQLERWRNDGLPSRNLRALVKALIRRTCDGADAATEGQGELLASKYFDLHKKLMAMHLLEHDQAVAFLSHAFLIAHLANSERLSAAQISRLLSQRDHRAEFSRPSVVSALQAMRIEPVLTQTQLQALYTSDSAAEPLALADADFPTATEIVADKGKRLGFPGDLQHAIGVLSPSIQANTVKSRFTPYLQILHYQCSVAEFFDHALTDVYEFSPRGVNGQWLHSQYPHSIAGADNPFLNNAKSVDICDAGWARAKRTNEKPGAMALFTILDGMQAMGFSARRELARWVRLWLHRVIRVAGGVVTPIPQTLTPTQINRLKAAIAAGNTGTIGILEQRMIDVFGVSIHTGWRPRGVGDSVNATNVSSAKFGDCEFLDAASKSVEAYEAHSGSLTALYVEAHIASLRKSILRRIDELNAIADLADWSARITFVAHSIDGALPLSVPIEGLEIQIAAMTFADFFATHAGIAPAILGAAISNHLLQPIQEQRTPNAVRHRLLAII